MVCNKISTYRQAGTKLRFWDQQILISDLTIDTESLCVTSLHFNSTSQALSMILRDQCQENSQTDDEDKAESIIDKLERKSLNIPGLLPSYRT